MRIDAFDYALPEELVATQPPKERDGARLLVLEPLAETGQAPSLLESTVRELASFVPKGALVVLNDTRVTKARLLGHKVGTGGKAEIFLVRKRPEGGYFALGKASKALREGTVIEAGSLRIEVRGRDEAQGLLRVDLTTTDGATVDEAIAREGHVPLPPYIKRLATAEDEERYQTVFAREDGAVAAPTAGLHVTRALLGRFADKGVMTASVTLHVGLGTFSPVTVEDLDNHPMHSETFTIPQATVRAIALAREESRPVVAIGTTVARALESAKDPDRPRHVRAVTSEETRLLIQPGYTFSIVDMLFTNFHLPQSTLLALVCAFGGHERVLAAYRHAVRTKMRFFSYGDAMFLARDSSKGAP
jgi:S-adenosylmethionine:tRNA ribosyltransferase-isomerase